MLVPVSGGDELTSALHAVIDRLGGEAAATVRTTDASGRRHVVWLLGDGREQAELIAIAGRHPLLVADGNHRVAVAAAGDPPGLLALVTGGPALRVGPIHRVLVDTGLGAVDLLTAWRRIGLDVVETDVTAAGPELPGSVLAVAEGGALRVELPLPAPDEPLPRIDHGVVEHLLIERGLGIDPSGPLVRPLPAGMPPPVDADAVLRMASVPYQDVLAVHEQGRGMPRKATYFTPKPRSGLLLARLR